MSDLDTQSGKSLTRVRLNNKMNFFFTIEFSILYCVYRRCCVKAIWSSKIHNWKATKFLIVISSCLLETKKVSYSLGWTLATCVDDSDFPLLIFLCPRPKGWDCRCESPCLV